MNILERGQQFLQSLQELAKRTIWDWRRCPHCDGMETIKYGTYTRHPWFLEGQREVKVQRHQCKPCDVTYSEESSLLKRESWYAREVQRSAVDHGLHLGTSLRYTARCCVPGWETGTLPDVETVGGDAAPVRTVSFVSQYGASLAGHGGHQ